MRNPSDTPEATIPRVAIQEAAVPEAAASRDVASPPTLSRLKRRADFLHAAKGRRWHGKALSLHAAPARAQAMTSDATTPDAPATARVGFTLTKKVGNAVVRNRARRRLREAVRLSDDLPARPGHDYVVVGRIDAVRVPFAALKREVARAVRDVHGARGHKPRAKTAETTDTTPRTNRPRRLTP